MAHPGIRDGQFDPYPAWDELGVESEGHIHFMDWATTSNTRVNLPLFGVLEQALGAPNDDSRPPAANELHGVPDGAPFKRPSGILIYRRAVGNAHVTQTELLAAARGISALPLEHQRAIAQAGIPVLLLPTAALEQGLLGATSIVQQETTSQWRPTMVRIAVRANRSGIETTPEITQHELGHVMSVLQRQDLSEAAAQAYARGH